MIPVLVGLFGLLIGSFLNVVVYRVPAGASLVSPPSACPRCSTPISPQDNVPVLSWVLLRGRCRTCAEPISARYPLVELGTGVLFGLTAWRFPVEDAASAVVLVAYLYLASIAVALALIDLDVHRLPDAIVLPSIVVAAVIFAVAAALGGDWGDLGRAAAAGAVLFAVYFLMLVAYPAGMGFGDVKLAAVLGIYLGWLGWGVLAVGAMAAFLLGGVFAVVLVVRGRAGRGSGIPFGPWMLLGAAVGIGVGQQAWDGYLGLFL